MCRPRWHTDFPPPQAQEGDDWWSADGPRRLIDGLWVPIQDDDWDHVQAEIARLGDPGAA